MVIYTRVELVWVAYHWVIGLLKFDTCSQSSMVSILWRSLIETRITTRTYPSLWPNHHITSMYNSKWVFEAPIFIITNSQCSLIKRFCDFEEGCQTNCSSRINIQMTSVQLQTSCCAFVCHVHYGKLIKSKKVKQMASWLILYNVSWQNSKRFLKNNLMCLDQCWIGINILIHQLSSSILPFENSIKHVTHVLQKIHKLTRDWWQYCDELIPCEYMYSFDISNNSLHIEK